MSDNNALDVLLGALPSDQAVSLASQFSITIAQSTTLSSATFTTSSDFSSSTATSTSPSSTTTTSPSITSLVLSTTTIPSSTSQQGSTTSASTSQALTAQSASSSQTASPAPAASIGAPKSPGAIAGITIGAIAAVVLILAVALYFFRRHRQQRRRQGGFVGPADEHGSGSSLLGSIKSFRRKRPQVFPEVAWLYDPVRPSSRGERVARGSNDSGPRLGANAPWSSRPSTSAVPEGVRPVTPAMAELPGSALQHQLQYSQPHQHQYSQTRQHQHSQSQQSQYSQPQQYQYHQPQDSLNPGIFQPPTREASPSQIAGFRPFSRPFGVEPHQHREEDVEDSISPLLPPPARFSTPDVQRITHGHSPVRSFDGLHPEERAYTPTGSPARDGHRRSRSFVVSPDGRTPATRMGRAF